MPAGHYNNALRYRKIKRKYGFDTGVLKVMLGVPGAKNKVVSA